MNEIIKISEAQGHDMICRGCIQGKTGCAYPCETRRNRMKAWREGGYILQSAVERYEEMKNKWNSGNDRCSIYTGDVFDLVDAAIKELQEKIK